jgi:thymidylate synthase
LSKVVDLLRDNPNTRKATISIYDGKEIDTYSKDTPCTYAVQFTILDGKLNMTVLMRSNDLWYGFCNDQFCFSRLQQTVADFLSIEELKFCTKKIIIGEHQKIKLEAYGKEFTIK